MDHLLHVGMSYRTAGLELRERLARLGPDTPAMLVSLADLASERVVLRTCGRFEVYAAGTSAGSQAFVERIATWAGLPASRLAAALQVLDGHRAVRHLLEVAAGLDSRILGEDQVLCQVRQAYGLARQAGCSGPISSALFQTAIHAGREVRRRTNLAGGCESMAKAAVLQALSEASPGPLECALVLGTGLMAQQTLHHLAPRMGGRVTVLSHHLERARQLAAGLGLQAAALDMLPVMLPSCRILISCTSAQRHLVTPDILRGRAAALTVIDLGLPRTIDPACAAVENVRLWHVDDLPECKTASEEARRLASRLVEQGGERFRLWCGGRRTVDRIRRLLNLAEGQSPQDARALRRALHSCLVRMKEQAA